MTNNASAIMMTAAVADNPSATMSTAFMPLYYLKRSKGAVKASFQERQWRRRSASSASASHWAARSSSSALILGSRARCAICRHLSALRRQRSAMSAGASILADAIPTAGVRSSGISGRPLRSRRRLSLSSHGQRRSQRAAVQFDCRVCKSQGRLLARFAGANRASPKEPPHRGEFECSGQIGDWPTAAFNAGTLG